MEDNKEEKKESNTNGLDLISAGLKFAQRSSLGRVAMFFVVILLAMQVAGLSLGTLTEKWFGLEEKKIDQAYDLQLKTFDIIETKVMPKLDDIYKRLDNVDERINLLESRVTGIELENKQYHNKK